MEAQQLHQLQACSTDLPIHSGTVSHLELPRFCNLPMQNNLKTQQCLASGRWALASTLGGALSLALRWRGCLANDAGRLAK